MRRLLYGMKIFLRDLASNSGSFLLPLAVLSLSVFVLFWFLLARHSLSLQIEKLGSHLQARVFLAPGASAEEVISAIRSKIKLTGWRYISPKEAWREFSNLYPDLASALGEENPIPPNILLLFPPGEDLGKIRAALNDLRRIKGVEDVVFQWEAVRKLRSLKGKFETVGGFLVLLLGLASALIIGNLVAVGVASHRWERKLMELLGASPGFSSVPFIFMGGLISLAGSFLGLGLFLSSYLILRVKFPGFFQPLPPLYLWSVPLAALSVGLLSSFISTREF